MNNTNILDCIIIGGGPAGSSAGAILAEHGHRVLLLEREKFPRYHIGESLLPFTFQPLQRLGLIDRMKSSAFVKKYSVQFVSPSGRASQPFYFYTRYDRDTVAQTWQVLRSEFDQMLLDNAREKGVQVREQTTVRELIREDGAVVGVRAQTQGGAIAEYRAPITLDCSGKESFAAVRNQWRVKDPFLNKIAVWTYYQGAQRDEGLDAGATTVAYVPEKGWFWYIPQHNDRISVGVVAEGKYLTRGGLKAPEEIFQREVEQNQWIKRHLARGRQTGPYFLTSEYTHHARHCGERGLAPGGRRLCLSRPGLFLRRHARLEKRRAGRRRRPPGPGGEGFFPGTLRRLRPFPARGRGKHAQARLCLLPSQIQLPPTDQQISRSRRLGHRLPQRRCQQRFLPPLETDRRIRPPPRSIARRPAFGRRPTAPRRHRLMRK